MFSYLRITILYATSRHSLNCGRHDETRLNDYQSTVRTILYTFKFVHKDRICTRVFAIFHFLEYPTTTTAFLYTLLVVEMKVSA